MKQDKIKNNKRDHKTANPLSSTVDIFLYYLHLIFFCDKSKQSLSFFLYFLKQ